MPAYTPKQTFTGKSIKVVALRLLQRVTFMLKLFSREDLSHSNSRSYSASSWPYQVKIDMFICSLSFVIFCTESHPVFIKFPIW